MKIAQIVCAYPPYAGGIGNSAKKIYDFLSQEHEVVNFTPDTLRPLWRRGHGALLPQLLWRLRGFDYIYLHYPFFGAAEIVWLFKLFAKKPKLIVHYHMDVKNLSPANRLLSRPSHLIRKNLLKKAEKIIIASLNYAKHSQIKDIYFAHPEKFEEIPFSVNLSAFRPKDIHAPSTNPAATKAKNLIKKITDLFIKRDRLDLIFVGGLDRAHYFKGVDILLKAAANLDKKRWRLRVVGDGDLRPEYEKLADDLDIKDRVTFSGRLSDESLIRALQDSDLLILPSINSNEAFGIVLIEALACGVPLIASDLPGVRSVFKEGREGLLVKPGDIADLSAKLKYIAQNEKKRREMAQAARRLAEIKYSEQVWQKSYTRLFLL